MLNRKGRSHRRKRNEAAQDLPAYHSSPKITSMHEKENEVVDQDEVTADQRAAVTERDYLAQAVRSTWIDGDEEVVKSSVK